MVHITCNIIIIFLEISTHFKLDGQIHQIFFETKQNDPVIKYDNIYTIHYL